MNKTGTILLCALLAGGCKDKRTDLANKEEMNSMMAKEYRLGL